VGQQREPHRENIHIGGRMKLDKSDKNNKYLECVVSVLGCGDNTLSANEFIRRNIPVDISNDDKSNYFSYQWQFDLFGLLVMASERYDESTIFLDVESVRSKNCWRVVFKNGSYKEYFRRFVWEEVTE
jgi:hypothetical protein